MSSLMVLVPQSIAATVTVSHLDAGTRRPPVAELVEHLVAERVHAAALGQRLAGQHVQALDPVRHAAGGDAVDLRHVCPSSALARREVALVRRGVGRGERRGRSPSRASISFISPEPSSEPIREAARGQVR